jgi:hypothetical protein
MKKGILIQALGHYNYYQMAVALAASIKVNESLPICLVTTHIVEEQHKFLFDIVKPPNEAHISNKGKIEFIKAKLFMYDLSPFDQTIFLDVDQLVIANRKLSNLFSELQDVQFTCSNTGIAIKSIWCNIDEVFKLYGTKPFYNLHSEFVYFKKCKEVKKYFDTAKKVYKDNKITSAINFANATMADELALQCASIITNVKPHQQFFTPNFWFETNPKIALSFPYELDESFYTYSIGGNSVPPKIKDNYNLLAKHYFAKLGLSNPYQVVDKRYFLPERIKM